MPTKDKIITKKIITQATKDANKAQREIVRKADLKEEIIKELDMKLNELIAYAVGGECGGRDVKDCKKDVLDFWLSKLKAEREDLLKKIDWIEDKMWKSDMDDMAKSGAKKALEDIKKLL